MAKFYGTVGFVWTEERLIDGEPSGIYDSITDEHNYKGDILQMHYGYQQSGEVNDDVKVSNRISFVADPFAYQHFPSIAYVKWMGSKWKVTDIELNYPRLNLSIGGIYNG